jgi:hypothetical protein
MAAKDKLKREKRKPAKKKPEPPPVSLGQRTRSGARGGRGRR